MIGLIVKKMREIEDIDFFHKYCLKRKIIDYDCNVKNIKERI
jgi:hypothetical protein